MLFLYVPALDDKAFAFSDGDEGAISFYFVGYGILICSCEGGVLEGVFTALDANALDLVGYGDNGKVIKMTSRNKCAGGVKITDSVFAVGHNCVNTYLRELCKKRYVGEGVVKSA